MQTNATSSTIARARRAPNEVRCSSAFSWAPWGSGGRAFVDWALSARAFAVGGSEVGDFAVDAFALCFFELCFFAVGDFAVGDFAVRFFALCFAVTSPFVKPPPVRGPFF
ncbi:hypothetical protein [Streptomyces violaceusniger]|uniref:hypothetical protein n=1 Tax=Streptomyces violaceusniger TaxID=68280 RepID=UPI0031D61EEB